MFILKHAVVGNFKSWRKNCIVVGTLCFLLTIIALVIVVYLTADSSISNYQQKYGQQVMISSKETEQSNTKMLTKEQYQKFGQSNYLKETKIFSHLMVILNPQKNVEIQDFGTRAMTILSGVEAKDFEVIEQHNEMVQGQSTLVENECLINEEFSKMYKIAMGDTLSFQTINKRGNLSQELELVVAGIYRPKENKQNQTEKNDSIKKIFIYTSMDTITSKKDLATNSDYSGLFELKETKLLSNFKKELYQKGLPKSYEVTMSDGTIQGYINQLEEVKRITTIILIVLLSFSILLLGVLIKQLFRKQEREFFVMQELGMSKEKIFLYRSTALLSITIGSFLFACLLVAILSPILLDWLSGYQSIAQTSTFETVGMSFATHLNPVMEQIIFIRSNDRTLFLAIFFGISLFLWGVMITVEGYCIFKTKIMELSLERT